MAYSEFFPRSAQGADPWPVFGELSLRVSLSSRRARPWIKRAANQSNEHQNPATGTTSRRTTSVPTLSKTRWLQALWLLALSCRRMVPGTFSCPRSLMGLKSRIRDSKLFMSKSISARLTLADSMIIIAAIALGLMGSRLFLVGEVPIPYMSPFERFVDDSRSQTIFMITVVVMSLTLASIAVPIANFRYRLRRLLRFPGTASCCGAVISLLMVAIYWTIRAITDPYDGGTVLVYFAGITLFSLLWCSIGVVTALVFVVLTGCCRLPPDWLDWLRLVIGLYWISMFFLVVAYR
jgi:hypothetical protein